MKRKVDAPLVIYGYGKLGELFDEAMNRLHIQVGYVIDKNSSKYGPTTHAMTDHLVAVCVATEPFDVLKKYISSLGYAPDNIVSAYDIFNAYPELGITNGWSAMDDPSDDDDRETELVRKGFSGYFSSCHYRAFLDWRMRRKENSRSRFSASTYCLPSTLKDIEDRRKTLLDWHHHRNFIDIHNEGRELEAVIKGMDDFKKYRPIINVACYHSRDGLWLIERTLMNELKDYSFTFQVKAYQGQAAYMYCIPKEML